MGLFSDRCSNENCRGRIVKGSVFCSLCGESAPKGLRVCAKCGKEVGSDKKFCWNCGADLSAMGKSGRLQDKWIRDAGIVSERFDESDVKGRYKKGFTIPHGSCALLFQKGELVDTLPAGKHDITKAPHKILSLSSASPVSIVLVDSGDLPFLVEGIRGYTSDDFEVDVRADLFLQIGDPESFYLNLLRDRIKITTEEMQENLNLELSYGLGKSLGNHTVEEIFKDPKIRQSLEPSMTEIIQPVLNRVGLSLVRIGFADFSCPAYEEIRKRRGKVGAKEKARDILERDAQLDMDGMEILTRKEQFKRDIRHELHKEDQARNREDDMSQQEHRHGMENTDLAHNIERDRLSKEAEMAMEKMEAEQEEDEAQRGMERLRKQKEMNLEIEEKRLKVRGEADITALISVLEGPSADKLLELEKFRLSKGMTEEQILAAVAENSAEAAHALGEKYRSEELQRLLDEERDRYESHARKLTQLAEGAMREMGEVATAKAGEGRKTLILTPEGRRIEISGVGQVSQPDPGESVSSGRPDEVGPISEDQRPDLFISYPRKRLSWVEENLYRPFKNWRGEEKVFFDTHAISPGAGWVAGIAANVANCRVFLPVYCEEYFESDFCQWELQMALIRDPTGKRRILFPIVLDGVSPPAYCSHIQTEDASGEGFAERIQAILEKVLS